MAPLNITQENVSTGCNNDDTKLRECLKELFGKTDFNLRMILFGPKKLLSFYNKVI